MSRLLGLNVIDQLPQKELEQLTKFARREAADQKMSDKLFSQVLQILKSVSSQIIWIKGTSLSRTIYQGDNQRVAGDFDAVVHSSKFSETHHLLRAHQFIEIKDPGFCNQLGVGPTESAEQLLLAPHPSLIPNSVTTMFLESWPPIDLKLGPLDRGIQMCDIDKFFEEAEQLNIQGQVFFGPCRVDQMMICLHTFAKDRFSIWKNLFDIHLLANEFSKAPELWQELVVRCKRESIEASAWASLVVSVDRLATVVPNSVLVQLEPPQDWCSRALTFAISPYFVWNANSLIMLLLNALTSSDRSRKLTLLFHSFFPSRNFIANYYNGGRHCNPLLAVALTVVHWLVIILPGGIVRKTFGKMLWPKTEITEKAPN